MSERREGGSERVSERREGGSERVSERREGGTKYLEISLLV